MKRFLFALAPLLVLLPHLALAAGSQTYSTPGTYSFTVPSYGTLTVQAWGGGGGGGGSGALQGMSSTITHGGAGSAGGLSAFGGVVGQGGGGGGGGNTASGSVLSPEVHGSAGSSGSGSGGDNTVAGGGAAGGDGGATTWLSPYGPGDGGKGGNGGATTKAFTPSTLPPGSNVVVTVGAGGDGGEPGTYIGQPLYATSGSAGSSGSVSITWTDPLNSPPTAPTISGTTAPVQGTSYPYTFRSTDPDSDTIRYAIDWDNNGSIDEYAPALGYVSSGTASSASHSWSTTGSKTFQAKAIDSNGNASGWTPYTVTVQTPPPTVLLTASPLSISTGQSSTLTWSSSNATSCTGTNFSTGGATQNTSPGITVSPAQTTTYTVTCTGTGGTASDSQTVTVSCAPTYTCTDPTTVHSSCPAPAGTDTSCAPGLVCSEGASACIPPPAPAFNSSGSGTTALSGHLQVRPSLLKRGDRTRVFWNVSNVQTCTVVGDNVPADSWTVAGSAPAYTSTSGDGGKQSAPIIQQTTYTLTCTPLPGQTFSPERASVNVVPVFRER